MDNEVQIIIALRNGSHQAFREVYEYYKVQVYRFILAVTRSESVSQEIFQHVFVKVWENRTNLDPQLSFQSYLFIIARHEIYSYWRKCWSRRKADEYLKTLPEVSEQTEIQVISDDLQEYFSKLISCLPAKRKKIVELRYLQGMSYREIAECLKISESTVDNQLQKAIVFLREQAKKEFLPVIMLWFAFLF